MNLFIFVIIVSLVALGTAQYYYVPQPTVYFPPIQNTYLTRQHYNPFVNIPVPQIQRTTYIPHVSQEQKTTFAQNNDMEYRGFAYHTRNDNGATSHVLFVTGPQAQQLNTRAFNNFQQDYKENMNHAKTVASDMLDPINKVNGEKMLPQNIQELYTPPMMHRVSNNDPFTFFQKMFHDTQNPTSRVINFYSRNTDLFASQVPGYPANVVPLPYNINAITPRMLSLSQKNETESNVQNTDKNTEEAAESIITNTRFKFDNDEIKNDNDINVKTTNKQDHNIDQSSSELSSEGITQAKSFEVSLPSPNTQRPEVDSATLLLSNDISTTSTSLFSTNEIPESSSASAASKLVVHSFNKTLVVVEEEGIGEDKEVEGVDREGKGEDRQEGKEVREDREEGKEVREDTEGKGEDKEEGKEVRDDREGGIEERADREGGKEEREEEEEGGGGGGAPFELLGAENKSEGDGKLINDIKGTVVTETSFSEPLEDSPTSEPVIGFTTGIQGLFTSVPSGYRLTSVKSVTNVNTSLSPSPFATSKVPSNTTSYARNNILLIPSRAAENITLDPNNSILKYKQDLMLMKSLTRPVSTSRVKLNVSTVGNLTSETLGSDVSITPITSIFGSSTKYNGGKLQKNIMEFNIDNNTNTTENTTLEIDNITVTTDNTNTEMTTLVQTTIAITENYQKGDVHKFTSTELDESTLTTTTPDVANENISNENLSMTENITVDQ